METYLILLSIGAVILFTYMYNNIPTSSVSQHTIIYWFHRPSCPHCENMKDEWEKLEKMMVNKKKYKVYAINTTESKNEALVNKYKVQGVPYIVKVSPNNKTEVYKGNRIASDMFAWVL